MLKLQLNKRFRIKIDNIEVLPAGVFAVFVREH